MLRDVTDLRHRDRMLVSKDATIREIHHRVKNNLQTIAALLRLQARRLQSPEARAALEESERRIRSIAVVHETLSRDASDVVPSTTSSGRWSGWWRRRRPVPTTAIRFEVEGDVGDLPGELATPLAVVLNELMQNAVDHAFPAGEVAAAIEGRVAGRARARRRRAGGRRGRRRRRAPGRLRPGGVAGLGLSIVHTLVTTEMGGSIELRDEHGARACGCGSRSPPTGGRGVREAASYAVARCSATQALRSLRRSSSVVPPQIPASWLVARANSRHSRATWQAVQMRRAVSICSSGVAGDPDREEHVGVGVPAGGAAAPARRVSQSCVRIQVSATGSVSVVVRSAVRCRLGLCAVLGVPSRRNRTLC